MSSNMERVAAMPDASLYVNRDGRRADDCVDSHGGGNLTKIPRSGDASQISSVPTELLPADHKRLQWRKSRGVSFIHHGDFRVAAVPESLSLLLSYLCM